MARQLGDGRLQTPEEIGGLVAVRRALARLGIADEHVQHGGAGVVAVARRLHLLVPGARDVAVARPTTGAEGNITPVVHAHDLRSLYQSIRTASIGFWSHPYSQNNHSLFSVR